MAGRLQQACLGLVRPRPTQPQRRLLAQEQRLRCYSGDDIEPSAHYDGADDEEAAILRERVDLAGALDEALEIYTQASEMSRLQVLGEMETSFHADMAPPSEGSEPDEGALLNFWMEQGLPAATAESLLRELQRSGRMYSTNQLQSKLTRLQRVLPNADIASMAAKDVGLLDADINTALLNMICLVEAFPGRDVMSLLARQPRLLWAADMRERVPRVFEKLISLHPSGDVGVVREIIAENPELLFRMDYYMDAPMLDYLPIEIQNMMVLTGQGLSFLYRYYNNKRTDYQAELYRNEFD